MIPHRRNRREQVFCAPRNTLQTKGLSGEKLKCVKTKNKFDIHLHRLAASIANIIRNRSSESGVKDTMISHLLDGRFNKRFNKRFRFLVKMLTDSFTEKSDDCFKTIFKDYYTIWSNLSYNRFRSLMGTLEQDSNIVIREIITRLAKDKAHGENYCFGS